MKHLLFAGALALTGCAAMPVTFNGQDVTRGIGITAAGVIAIGILAHHDKGGSDKTFRCPTCPPLAPAE